MKHESFESLLTKCPECFSNDRWEKCILDYLIMFMYLHSFPALKLRKVIKIDFRQDLIDFWGDGDELNNFQDSSISLLSMKLRKHDSFERFLTKFPDLKM